MPFTTEMVGAYGGAQFTGSDYTDKAVTQPFMNFYADLFAIANRTTPPTPAEAAALQEDLIKLLNIAQNGISVQNEAGGKSVTYFMTAQMVDSLNELLKNVQAGGVTDLPAFTTDQLAAWQTNVQQGSLATGLNFNVGLFNIFYYVSNWFGNTKVSLNTAESAAELAAALSRTGGDVAISPYSARSLQAMTEVDYVNEGNQLINDTLTKMYEALGITKKVLDDLANLQSLHNGLKVVSRQDNITYLRRDISTGQIARFQSGYEARMSALTSNLIPQLTEEYSPWLFPGAEIHFSGLTATSDVSTSFVYVWVTIPADQYLFINPTSQYMVSASGSYTFGGYMRLPLNPSEFENTSAFKAKLANLVAYQTPDNFVPLASSFQSGALMPGNPNNHVWPLISKASSLETVRDNLVNTRTRFEQQVQALSAAAGTDTSSSTYLNIINNPQSLYNLSKQVLSDLDNVDSLEGARAWMIDNYQAFNTPDATKAGLLQQNITKAITAAQSTNDEQKETVRNNLFLFEEFYKSASTVLTMLNQIITKMGQNIAR